MAQYVDLFSTPHRYTTFAMASMEVTEVDLRTLPDQVVEDSPNARIPDALLYYTCPSPT